MHRRVSKVDELSKDERDQLVHVDASSNKEIDLIDVDLVEDDDAWSIDSDLKLRAVPQKKSVRFSVDGNGTESAAEKNGTIEGSKRVGILSGGIKTSKKTISQGLKRKGKRIRESLIRAGSKTKSVSDLSKNMPEESLMVRAPDIDDDLFEHEDIFASSPYLDLNLTPRKHKIGATFNKMYGILAVSKEQQKFERYAFVAVMILLSSVSFLVFLPSEVNPVVSESSMYTDNVGLYAAVPPYIMTRLAGWYEPDRDNDLPFFWTIPMSGGLLYADIVGTCYHLIQASEVGASRGVNANDKDGLRIVEIFGDSFVNVDTTTNSGIERAYSLRLAESGLADIVFSPQFNGTVYLFNKINQGRFFTIFRHPVQRSANMYHYFSKAKWDTRYNPYLQNITLDQFALSTYVENNYMTRLLLNKPGGALSSHDLNTAKEIIRQKCLVGLYDKLEESIERFEKYFHWTGIDNLNNDQDCVNRVLTIGYRKYDIAPLVKQGSNTWDLLYQQNIYDVQLYEFARVLFKLQEMKDIN